MSEVMIAAAVFLAALFVVVVFLALTALAALLEEGEW